MNDSSQGASSAPPWIFWLVAAGLCLAVIPLRIWAWQAGWEVNNATLAGCHLGRIALLLAAATLLVRAVVRCFARSGGRSQWVNSLRVVVALMVLAVVSWQIPAIGEQALLGLEARCASKARPEDLLAWAAKVLQDTPEADATAQRHFIEPEQLPDFVMAMLGSRPGKPRAEIVGSGANRHVWLAQGSGMMWFNVDVGPPPFGDDESARSGGHHWGRGIVLSVGM